MAVVLIVLFAALAFIFLCLLWMEAKDCNFWKNRCQNIQEHVVDQQRIELNDRDDVIMAQCKQLEETAKTITDLKDLSDKIIKEKLSYVLKLNVEKEKNRELEAAIKEIQEANSKFASAHDFLVGQLEAAKSQLDIMGSFKKTIPPEKKVKRANTKRKKDRAA